MFGIRFVKYLICCLCVVVLCRPAYADIEPINVVVKNAVAGVEEAKKQYYDLSEQYNKIRAGIEKGRAELKKLAGDIKEFMEDPIGVLSAKIMNAFEKDDPEETETESMEKAKQTYSRTAGMKDNIAAQKALDKVLNDEKFNNISILFARSISKRLELKNEESKEPDLSTLAAAQSAATDSMIKSSRRWNALLMTQAYTHSFIYTIEAQNYQNDPTDENEE